MRILLVEDHVVNQKVALNLIEQLGYHADLAGNGLQALEAVRRQQYDIVLMDVLMPEMDGFETTHGIRQQSPPECQPHIIALTALVMPEDRDRYLAAGMNDYVSKPVDIAALQAAFARWEQADSRGGDQPLAKLPRRTAPEFTDLLGLREMEESAEPDIVTELITMFLEDAAAWLGALRQAVNYADAVAFERAAHSLKGSCASIGAQQLAACCADLERRGRTGQITGLEPLLAQLEAEFTHVRSELEVHCHRL